MSDFEPVENETAVGKVAADAAGRPLVPVVTTPFSRHDQEENEMVRPVEREMSEGEWKAYLDLPVALRVGVLRRRLGDIPAGGPDELTFVSDTRI